MNLGELSQEHLMILEAPIRLEEINEAIVTLQCNSSPGSDGLTPEFYKRFGHLLVGHPHELFTSCFIEGEISPTWRLEKITLLRKQEKDLWFPESS